MHYSFILILFKSDILQILTTQEIYNAESVNDFFSDSGDIVKNMFN